MDRIGNLLHFVCRAMVTALITISAGSQLLADTTQATITSPTGPLSVTAGQTVTFKATSAAPTGMTNYVVTSYSWAFGDGTSSTGLNVSHAYSPTGQTTYTVTLSVNYSGTVMKKQVNDEGVTVTIPVDVTGTSTAIRSITVIPSPSITSFTASSYNVRAGLAVTLNWSVPAGMSLTLSASQPTPGTGSVSGTSLGVNPSVTTTYTLTASNSLGVSTSLSVTVTTYSVVVTVSPTSATIPLGGSQAFTGSASPANQGVSWSATGGSLNGSSFTGTSSGSFIVTARSLEDSSKFANATVTVSMVGVSTPTPSGGSVNAGSTLQFAASVSGAVNTGLSWSVSGGGSISGSGLFSATTAGTYTVTATSNADSTKSASTSVTVNSVVTGVTINPTSVSLRQGESTTFTASATGLGGNNPGVTWSASGGSLSNGVYTAPIAAGSYTVTATSVQNSSQSASATVSVSPLSVATPTPVNSPVNAGSTLQFGSSVSGVVNTGLTWTVSGGGSINSSGLYTAATAGTFTVTATSSADPTKSASTSVTVIPVVSGMTLTAPKSSLLAGESIRLTATVSGLGGGSTAVTWAASAGSIATNGDGTYTAPFPVNNSTVSVTATSVQDTAVIRTLSFPVSAVSVVSISPSGGSVDAGNSIQLSARVDGAVNSGVSWNASGGGTINTSTGLFSATTSGNYTITATSLADPSKSASTTLTVKAVVTSVTVTPGTASLKPGDTQKFTASVTGLGGISTSVNWTASRGTIASDGTYTVPNSSGTVTITATSVQDPTKFGTATATVKGWILKWTKNIVYVGTKEIAEVEPQGTHVTLVDHLGSSRFQIGSSGQLENSQKFLPFGETLGGPLGVSKFAKGFTNHEQTDPSGLIYMQARFYAPWYGRFLSPDPARDQHFEETQSWNIYSYVRNNPTMHIDPNGMEDYPIADMPQMRVLTLTQSGIPAERAERMVAQEQQQRTVAGGTATAVLATGGFASSGTGAMMLSRVGLGLSSAGNWLKEKGSELLESASNLLGKGREFQNVTADEIRQINSANGGSTELTGKAETVLANMGYREGFADKASTMIRDIAGRHLFNDANKRTAQQTVELLAGKNKVSLNSAQLRSIIQQVAEGKLKQVEDISKAVSEVIKK